MLTIHGAYRTLTLVISFAPGFSTDIDQQVHAVKFGVNYKFGFPGAVTARY